MASPWSSLSALALIFIHLTLVCPQPLVNRATVVDSATKLKRQYDYVIVGGGTSGLTVANRLTNDSSGTLLEKGDLWQPSAPA